MHSLATMTSSTDVISSGSGHGDDDGLVSPASRRYRSYTSSQNSHRPSEEVQEEIDAMIESIPQVDEVFTIINKIGSGTFSSVYVAKLKKHPEISQMFALKHIIPTSHPSRIESELRCLYDIGGVDNVMGVKACFRERDHVVIVMPYFPHDKFQDYVQILSVADVQLYLRELLVALRRVHAVDIIHRDVKPSNFLFNRKLKKFALVDFGLAQKAPVPLKEGTEEDSTTNKPKHGCKSVATRTDGHKKAGRSHSENTQPSRSPQKRKFRSDDIENMPESPRKRRQLSEGGANSVDTMTATATTMAATGLALLDTNKQATTPQANLKKSVTDSKPLLANRNLLKPAYMKPTVKSPRRILLTKRAMDQQKCGLFDPKVGNKSGTSDRKGHVIVTEKDGQQMYKMIAPTACKCFGQPTICSICMSRSGQHAPRAGTPGFRAPEVLLKCPEQTTAVDIWSAGVIFLSLLSGRYPFFKAPDDMTALAQIIAVMGSEGVIKGALSIGKNLICNRKTPSLDLPVMCRELRRISNKRHLGTKSSSALSVSRDDAEAAVTTQVWDNVPDSAYDLLRRLLDVNPHTRATADEALRHPFFSENV